MTVVVTRNVPAKFRGFLASTMLEIVPGVYLSPHLNVAVRERIWDVLIDWWQGWNEAGVVMVWRDAKMPSGIGIQTLGAPKTDVLEYEGLFLARHEISANLLNKL